MSAFLRGSRAASARIASSVCRSGKPAAIRTGGPSSAPASRSTSARARSAMACGSPPCPRRSRSSSASLMPSIFSASSASSAILSRPWKTSRGPGFLFDRSATTNLPGGRRDLAAGDLAPDLGGLRRDAPERVSRLLPGEPRPVGRLLDVVDPLLAARDEEERIRVVDEQLFQPRHPPRPEVDAGDPVLLARRVPGKRLVELHLGVRRQARAARAGRLDLPLQPAEEELVEG